MSAPTVLTAAEARLVADYRTMDLRARGDTSRFADRQAQNWPVRRIARGRARLAKAAAQDAPNVGAAS
jgi:hypothetical protein